ncbi:MAG: helix-turn-helix transcriptional regulator [Erysipelotrichaceae bacterium]|nr:helix-turn-helix transcriptional regulator [Erysipelotrichaceae bacterium]
MNEHIWIDQLKTYKTFENLSQEEIARDLDVSFVTVNRWLTGKHVPNRRHQKRIQALIRER